MAKIGASVLYITYVDTSIHNRIKGKKNVSCIPPHIHWHYNKFKIKIVCIQFRSSIKRCYGVHIYMYTHTRLCTKWMNTKSNLIEIYGEFNKIFVIELIFKFDKNIFSSWLNIFMFYENNTESHFTFI